MRTRKNVIDKAAGEYGSDKTLASYEGFKAGAEWVTKNGWMPVKEVLPSSDNRGNCMQRIAIYNANTNNFDKPNGGIRIFNRCVLRWDMQGRAYVMYGEPIEFTHWLLMPKDLPSKTEVIEQEPTFQEEKSEWNDVKVCLPPFGVKVLVYFPLLKEIKVRTREQYDSLLDDEEYWYEHHDEYGFPKINFQEKSATISLWTSIPHTPKDMEIKES